MAPTNKLTYFAAAVVLILASQALPADARRFIGINPFCQTASYRKPCTDMVKGAKTWREASANVMESALQLAKKLKDAAPEPAKLGDNVPKKDPVSQRNQVLEICKDQMDGVVDDLESSLEALRINDIGTIRSHLSAALRTDCQDSMKESDVDYPLRKYLGVMKRNIDNCLAVVMQN